MIYIQSGRAIDVLIVVIRVPLPARQPAAVADLGPGDGFFQFRGLSVLTSDLFELSEAAFADLTWPPSWTVEGAGDG
ncbi:hypothetical protein AB0392_45680 [Nonomuraea angiospora]|uniref:hypothetical protein n=1 Tax=Nonomuraea angiospora TaxID=46172 RepID=UPI0034505F4C